MSAGRERDSTPGTARQPERPEAPRPAALPGLFGVRGVSNAAIARLIRDGPGAELSAASAGRIGALMRGGDALPAGQRAGLEGGLGVSLDGVRVHGGEPAAEAADSVGAAAFTVGQHIFLGRGGAAPDVVAHEVVHTVQNRGIPAAPAVAAGTPTTDPAGAVETEAVSIAARLASGAGAGAQVTGRGPAAVAGAWRWAPDTRTPRQQIDDALRSEDADDVKAISNVYLATVDERIKLLEILVDQWWAGNSDELKMEEIWGSFGSSVLAVAGPRQRLWDNCVDKGADLDELPEIERVNAGFVADVTALARQFLELNAKAIEAEVGSYGLPPSGSAPAAPTAAQTAQVMDLQKIAQSVALLQLAQEQARATPVGYEVHVESIAPDAPAVVTVIPAMFDPNKPPQLTEDPDIFLTPTFHADLQPYEPIRKAYAETEALLAVILKGYPAIYAVTRANSSAATERFAAMNPAAARAELSTGLHAVLGSIASAQEKLGDDLDPLDLLPLHEQLYHGTRGASGVDWTGVMAQRLAREQVKDHELYLALRAMGLQLGSQLLFILAPFTGGATLALAFVLGGVTLAGVQWSMSGDHYRALADAAGTAATPGTELVTNEQVAAAEAAHTADTVALGLAVLTAGLALAGAGVAAMRTRMLNAQRAALLNEVGPASNVNTFRAAEVPYTEPPDLRVAKPGQPLALDELKPGRRYLWVIDEAGNFKVADEGQAGMFPKRAPLPEPHPSAGEAPLKHGDLSPGPQGQARGAARAGGELRAEFGPDGKFTGRWMMNNDSSYTFNRVDGQMLGQSSLDAAHKLLGTTGTDMSKIFTANTSGAR
ncbi:DUF4157 domain-containing protein [Amorphoplanes digitatis]|uniref:eCIS core domain-containing protein n=1 Tax=Actinoplanes digitatis TaxID=1868 RepID=A0A7W7HVV8_9ACTN|nr:DUF4157 domain-containing protein [Actinoplanes digitatis]MBB4761757.1 hypothetical protein [Actinoplanes digitatis]